MERWASCYGLADLWLYNVQQETNLFRPWSLWEMSSPMQSLSVPDHITWGTNDISNTLTYKKKEW
jgi:hypothetical protein